MRSAVRAVVRLVVWSGLFIGGLAAFFAAAPYAGAALRHVSRSETLSIFVALVAMAFALLTAIAVLRGTGPGRREWMAVNIFVMAIGAATIYWLPGWSGVVSGCAFVLLILIPSVLVQRASRQLAAGRARRAALSMWVASRLHPSRPWRFHAAFLAAQAIGAIGARVAALAALRRNATPVQTTLLDQWTAAARDDWASVLQQSRGAAEEPFLEVRALGELGRLDDMVAAYAKRQWRLDRTRLPFCRLYVLAFSGRRDSVRALLKRQMRFLAPDRKAYWAAIAAQAADSDDTEPRRALAQFAGTSEDETFRRAAARHLAAPARGAAVALSPGSLATIARIEAALR